jgi:hypothetical protein
VVRWPKELDEPPTNPRADLRETLDPVRHEIFSSKLDRIPLSDNVYDANPHGFKYGRFTLIRPKS